MTRAIRTRKRMDHDRQGLDRLVYVFAECTKIKRDAEEERKQLQPQVIDAFHQEGLTKHTVAYDDETQATAQLKTRDNSGLNPEKLKKAIGAKAYNKLTTPTLDESKVEAAIQLGEVDPNVVSQCMDEKTSEYMEVRFSQRRRR